MTDDQIRRLLVSAVYGAAVVAVVAASMLLAIGVSLSLVGATYALGLVIFIFVRSATVWQRLADHDARSAPLNPQLRVEAVADDRAGGGSGTRYQLAEPIRNATNVAITVQGVVLGLVFAFVDKAPATVTVKVAGVSLTVGVLVGFLLYALVALEVSGTRCAVLATFLFNVTLWALMYGLLCIAAALLVRPAAAPAALGGWL